MDEVTSKRKKFLLSLFILGVTFACNPSLTVSRSENQQYRISDTQGEETAIHSFIKPYHDSLESQLGKVIVYSDIALITGSGKKDMPPEQTAMGNFMVDACMFIAKQRARELSKPAPDISIFTWGSIRKSLPAGNITLNNIFELMPFENEMVVLKLTGSETKQLLNQLAKRYDPIGGALITKAEVNQLFINGNALDENKIYYVLASDYLSFGGDNLTVLKNASERYFCGVKVRDAIIQYLESLQAKGETLKPDYEQRIKN